MLDGGVVLIIEEKLIYFDVRSIINFSANIFNFPISCVLVSMSFKYLEMKGNKRLFSLKIVKH